MSFISGNTGIAGYTFAEAYGTSAAPISFTALQGPLINSLTIPPRFFLDNYIVIESAFRRSALGLSPVALTGRWDLSTSPALTSPQNIANNSIAAILGSTWRTYAVAWGVPSGVILGSTFGVPGQTQTNTFVDRALDPLNTLYLGAQVFGAFDIGDIVDLIYYKITAYRRA